MLSFGKASDDLPRFRKIMQGIFQEDFPETDFDLDMLVTASETVFNNPRAFKRVLSGFFEAHRPVWKRYERLPIDEVPQFEAFMDFLRWRQITAS